MFTGLGGESLWLCPTLNDSANDLSGHNRNGIYRTGTADPMTTVADTGAGGSRAYDFNDYGKRITCSTVGSGTTDGVSVSFWLYMNTWPDFRAVFDFNGAGSNANDSLTFLTRNGSDSRYGQYAMQAFIRPDFVYDGIYLNPIGTGSWFHVCTNRVAGTSDLDTYVNGVKVVTLANQSGTVSLANGCTIGSYYDGIRSIDGRMDDFRLFTRALTQSEITHLASSRGVQGGPYYKPLTLKSRVTRLLSNRVTLLERIRSASKPTTPISIKVKHNEEPSYKAGYAKNAGESENPDLWDGLTGAWVPNLGIGSGLKIKNLAVKNDEGDLKNDIEWSQKGMIQNDADQYVLLPDGYVNTEGTVIGSIDPIGVYSYWRSSIVWSSRNWVVEIKMVGNGSFIASCYKWGGSGFVLVNSSLIQRDKSYTLASSFKDGDTLKLYVDGNLAGEAAYTGANQTQAGWSARIFSYSDPQPGQHNWANPYLYGPVLLYKRVLSASEIKTLSEDLLAPFRRKKSPIGYQPIKEVKGLIRT